MDISNDIILLYIFAIFDTFSLMLLICL